MDPQLMKLLNNKSAAKKSADRKQIADAIHELAYYYKTIDEFDKSISEFEELCAFYKKHNDTLNFAKTHRFISEIYLEQGDFKQSLKYESVHYNKVLELNDKVEQQRSLATLSRIYLTQAISMNHVMSTENQKIYDILVKAQRFAEKSLSMCDELTCLKPFDKSDMSARVLQNLAVIYEHLSEVVPKYSSDWSSKLDNGIICANKARNLCNENANYKLLHKVYVTIAQLYSKKDNHSACVHNLNNAINVLSRIKRSSFKKSVQYEIYVTLTDQYMKLSQYHNAKRAAIAAVCNYSGSQREKEVVFRKAKLITLLLMKEEELLQMAISDYKTRQITYEVMGAVCYELKEFQKAVRFYTAMLECCERCFGNQHEMASCFLSLAYAYRQLGEYKESITYFRKELLTHSITDNNVKLIASKLKNLSKLECLLDPNKELSHVYSSEVYRLQNNDNEDCKDTVEILLNLLTSSSTDDGDHDDNENGFSRMQLAPFNLDDIDINGLLNDSDGNENDENRPNAFKRKRQPDKFSSMRNEKGEYPLHRACITGDLALVRLLLKNGHPVRVRDDAGWLPIHEASNYGHCDIMELLIDNGSPIDDDGDERHDLLTPLLDAAANGQLKACELLINHNASVIATSNKNETLLDFLESSMRDKRFQGPELELYNKLVSIVSTAFEKTVRLSKTGDNNVNQRLTDRSYNRTRLDNLTVTDSPPPLVVERHEVKMEPSSGISLGISSEAPTLDPLVIEEDPVHHERDVDIDDWLEDDLGEQNRLLQRQKRQRRSSFEDSNYGQINLVSPDTSTVSDTNTSVNMDIVGINVKIQTKVFRIPIVVHESRDLTVGWLAEEASRRYFIMEGLKPKLEFRTLDGAILSHSDPLCSILSLNTIDSNVISWLKVQFQKRYQELCLHEKIEICQEMYKVAEKCEATHTLSLKNEIVEPEILLPLVKSLNNQKFVCNIDLSRNSLSTETIQLLGQTLKTLDNLRSLSLSTANLDVEHLTYFADMLKDNRHCLPVLNSFDLSCNPLGNSSVPIISTILDILKSVENLNLDGCDFVNDIFLKDTVKWDLNSVKLLSLAMNDLDLEALKSLFKQMNWSILKNLDLNFNNLTFASIYDIMKSNDLLAQIPTDKRLHDIINLIDNLS